ncbi:MAG: hypothetical protein HRU20_02835 [Pseudomonadales bacterium]|nr:hypothetical protein [Pseudomonadales bacterium]
MPQSSSKTHIFIAENYPSIKLSLNEFEDLFTSNTDEIQGGRNTLKQLDLAGIKTVVKAFKIPNLLQGFVYKFLRKSKARRSFEYAQKLLDKGINTPKPIAYIEVFNRWQLQQSYFISELLDYDYEIRDVLRNKTDDKQRLLREFAEFTYHFHQCGFLHLDYSTGNTLIKKTDQGYQFSVVDINRMSFGPVSPEVGIKNFSRISDEPQNIQLFCEIYSGLSGLAIDKCETLLNQAIQEHANYWIRKRKLKKLIGR